MSEVEVLKIWKAFPEMPKEEIKNILMKYSTVSREVRFHKTTSDIIETLEKKEVNKQLVVDASTIRDIFPDILPNQIYARLRALGNIENRVKIVLKDIVADEDKKIFPRDMCQKKAVTLGKLKTYVNKKTTTDGVAPVSGGGGNTAGGFSTKIVPNASGAATNLDERQMTRPGTCNGTNLLNRASNNKEVNLADFGQKKLGSGATTNAANGHANNTNSETEVYSMDSHTNDNSAATTSAAAGAANVRPSYRRTKMNPPELHIKKEKSTARTDAANGRGNHINIKTEVDPVDFRTQDTNFPATTNDCNGGANVKVKTEKSAVTTPDANDGIDLAVLYRITEIFPDADPQFLRIHCKHKTFIEADIDGIINTLLSMKTYPKRLITVEDEQSQDPEDEIELLKQVLPDADPTYLKKSMRSISSQEDLRIFINHALETKTYPTYTEHLRKENISAQIQEYTTNFNVEKFVELFPDPKTIFNSVERTSLLATQKTKFFSPMLHVLQNTYNHLPLTDINRIFLEAKDIMSACKKLEDKKLKPLIKIRNKKYTVSKITNIPLLQVLAYITHKKEIHEYIKNKIIIKQKERKAAKEAGLMQTCGCCYEEEVMPADVINCARKCVLCKFCVQRSVEIAFSEGKLEYPCLLNCGSNFSLQVLQTALQPNLFSKVAQKKQAQEVKAAGIEDLECCPFCDFATIPPPDDKIFRCLNSECMTESCRACKEISHIPLKCDEVERDIDVEQRTYVENKMTEALIRKCYKCGLKFVKEGGCNLMTCSCKATMCYICNIPVPDYSHFDRMVGEKPGKSEKCPLYSNIQLLHKNAVLESAAAAKKEIGNDLRFDPTLNTEQYYEKVLKQPVNDI